MCSLHFHNLCCRLLQGFINFVLAGVPISQRGNHRFPFFIFYNKTTEVFARIAKILRGTILGDSLSRFAAAGAWQPSSGSGRGRPSIAWDLRACATFIKNCGF